jgi:hypothetical protein
MKFTLDFKSDDYGKKIIDEPFGLNQISFSLKQKENGIARDISLTSGEAQFEFTHMRNHELKQLLYYHRKFGFESLVNLIIDIDEDNSFVCELDFADAETDDLEYFRCKGIQQGAFQVLKRRNETIVDLKSNTDVDGNYIGGLIPDNVLLLAKPISQRSIWTQMTPTNSNWTNIARYVNITQAIKQGDIENTLCPFISDTSDGADGFQILDSLNNLNNVQLKISNIDIGITGVDTQKVARIYLLKANSFPSGFAPLKNAVILYDSTGYGGGSTIHITKDINYNIGNIQRGEKIWLFLYIGQGLQHDMSVSINSINTQIDSISIAYNSVSPSFRLIDVMKQVVKSVSGLQVNAPRFDVGGEFYDNRLVDGNFLRVIKDKNFSVSLSDLEKSITEMNGDWEIGSDGKIFFGIEKDFYTPIESGFFDNTQFSEMNKTFNPKYKVNDFYYRYNNYQSLKENEEPNSADTIHGESRFVFFNKLVENKKEVNVQWTRDAFLIEETRRKALVIDKNTASQNDDTLFCIDSIGTTFDNSFTEVATLNHAYSTSNGRLSLINDGSLNFLSLGIQVGSVFKINAPDQNTGTYTVFSVLDSSLELTGASGGSAGNGIRNTKFTYTLSAAYVPFTNYTDQGFSETSNLGSADSYSNRRYSIARNIYNYWKSYLATCNLYWKEKAIKNTWYKNNGDYTAKYNGIKLTEKANFIPDNPILSPMLYNDIVFANVEFSDFIVLQNKIRSERGFIRTIDNNQQVIKIYPVDMDYKLLEKELTIKGEEKFEPVSMTISTEFNYILVNNETRLLALEWEIIDEKLYLFDENHYRLYNGIYWMEVAINGANANSVEQLKKWLNLL